MNHTAQYQISYEDFREAIDGISRDVRKRATKGTRGSIFGWVLFISFAVVLFLLNKQPSATAAPPPAVTTEPDMLRQFVLPLIPWLLVFGFVWFFFVRQLRGPHRKAWEDNPSMHRSRSVTIDEDGLSFVEPTSQTRVCWDHYVRFAESPNLFLLFNSEQSAEIIPKRIFVTSAELDEFRSLLTRRISPPTGAFPVLPAASPK